MSTLKIESAGQDGRLARVTLSRPEVRNAFNEAVIGDLTAVFLDLGARKDLRAIVLAAEGKAFCAGADLNWMRAMAQFSWDENFEDARRLADMLWAIYHCPVPVVARVQGDVYAGGVGLVACADVVVSTANAGYCLSEAKLGLLPATIGPYVVKAMGERQARRYFTTAERFDAATAQTLPNSTPGASYVSVMSKAGTPTPRPNVPVRYVGLPAGAGSGYDYYYGYGYRGYGGGSPAPSYANQQIGRAHV